jgi:hypothetical protein
MCPGSFTFGLDSPERGESRWSQNYARMLAMAGHDVYAASMNKPEPRVHYGVKLLNELEVAKYGPYDLYIDSSWWDTKKPYALAKKYICLKWSVETYMREWDFPDNFYFSYPYPSHHFEFAKFKNANKSFALPTMFGTEFPAPRWDNGKIFLPGKIDQNRDYQRFMQPVAAFLGKHPIEGGSVSYFKEKFAGQIDFTRADSNWYELAPYNKVMEAMSRCKLSCPIMNPGCIIEATFQGLASIFWEHGGFFNPLGQSLDIMVQHDAPPERFTELAERMMNDKKKYREVVQISQDYFSPHLYKNALKYFNTMIEEIF